MSALLRRNLLPFRIYEAVTLGDLFVIVFFVPFLLAKGLSMGEILTLHAIQNGLSLLTDIPSGYVSDMWKRKYVLFLSAFIRAGAYLLMWFGEDFWMLALAWGIAGIGSSFHSGTNSAFLFDMLKAEGKTDRYAYEWGMVKAWGFYVFVAASLVGGYFLALDPTSPPLLNFILFAAVAFVPLFMQEPPRSHLKTPSDVRKALTLLRLPFQKHKDLIVIILFGACFAALAQSSLFLVQYYLGVLGIVGLVFGALMAADYLGRGFISQNAYRLTRRLSTGSVLAALALALALGTTVPALYVSLFLIPFFILISFARGLHTVAIDTLINNRVASEIRATFLSGGTTAFKLLYIGIAPLFGWTTDAYGIQVALCVLGALSVASLFLLTPLRKQAAT